MPDNANPGCGLSGTREERSVDANQRAGRSMRIDEAAAAARGSIRWGKGASRIRSISFDSRSVSDGSLFVAMRGGYVDGHRYLGAALRNGALAAMVERGTSAIDLAGYAAVIEVDDTRAALAPLAAAYYGHPSEAMTVIGITGTDGKTTTGYFVDAICRAAGMTTGIIGTVEVRIGDESDRHSTRQTTPESLQIQELLSRMRDRAVSAVVLEATSHGLAMHRLDSCGFDVGVVTNVTHEHLDFHGSVERYRDAKGQLLRFVDMSRERGKLGIAVINNDDDGARSIAHYCAGGEIVWCSPSGCESAFVRSSGKRLMPNGSEFELQIGTEQRAVRIHLPGGHNIDNAVMAAGTGHALGVGIETIAKGLGSLRSVPGRMEHIDEGQPFTVLVDYAHSPEAIRGILGEARRLTHGRVLVLFGSAGERDIEKRSLQGAIAAELADFAIFSSEDPRFENPDQIIEEIARGASEAGARRGVDFECIEDRRLAIERILNRAEAGDVVVLAGKGHERSMIYGAEFRPWDEAGVARTVLRSLGYSVDLERRNAHT